MISTLFGLDDEIVDKFSARPDLLEMAYDWMRWPNYRYINRLRRLLPDYHAIQPTKLPTELLRGIRYVNNPATAIGAKVLLAKKQSNIMGLPTKWQDIDPKRKYRYLVRTPTSFTTSRSTAIGFAKTGDSGYVLTIPGNTLDPSNLLWYSGELYWAMVKLYKNKRSVASSLLEEYAIIPDARGVPIEFTVTPVNDFGSTARVLGWSK